MKDKKTVVSVIMSKKTREFEFNHKGVRYVVPAANINELWDSLKDILHENVELYILSSFKCAVCGEEQYQEDFDCHGAYKTMCEHGICMKCHNR